jgi:hypothetical protein
MKLTIATAAGLGVAVALILLLWSSWTEDRYVCHSCKGFGQSTAFRAFRCRIIRTPIRLTRSLTGKECAHRWEWYFANSHAICFNSREDWDGPIGTYPYHEELEKQRTENQTLRRVLAVLLLSGVVCFLSGGCAATRELISTDELAIKTVETRLNARSIEVFASQTATNVMVRLHLNSSRVPNRFALASDDLILREEPRRGRAVRPDPGATPIRMFAYIQEDTVMWDLGYLNGHNYLLSPGTEKDFLTLHGRSRPSFSTTEFPCLFRYQTPKNSAVVIIQKTLLFPVAVVFDIVTAPYQILMKIKWGKD